jgi:hypothetical protein
MRPAETHEALAKLHLRRMAEVGDIVEVVLFLEFAELATTGSKPVACSSATKSTSNWISRP